MTGTKSLNEMIALRLAGMVRNDYDDAMWMHIQMHM